jgi:hypothetical protein
MAVIEFKAAKRNPRKKANMRDSMKSKAHLYLPWSVVADWVASMSSQLPKVQPNRLRPPLASIEQLENGCVLFRLTAHQ